MQPEAQQQALNEMREKREAELKLRSLLTQLLEPAALERMANVRISNPETYQKAASLVVYLYQQGQLKEKMNEEQLKQLLSRFAANRREGKITFARK